MTNLICHCQLISFIDLHTCNFTPELGEKCIVEETEIPAPIAAEAKTTTLHFQSGAWAVYRKNIQSLVRSMTLLQIGVLTPMSNF